MESADYVVIGAGFGGAATAYHLARRGAGDILLLEREAIPGFHASGRNAAMIRQCVPDPAVLALAREGAAFLRKLPDDWPAAVAFKQQGSLLIAADEGWERLKRDVELGRSVGIEVELWTPEHARRKVPVLEGAIFDGAAWSPSDGILDIHALLSGYLRYASDRGMRIVYGGAVRAINHRGSELFEVVTDRQTISARIVINAAGAWANEIARMAGAAKMPLHPCRRHLFISPPLDWVDSSWPFIWDVSHEIYFRPEGKGLLLCACDQDELPPGDPPLDRAVQELLAEKIERYLPGLSTVPIQRSWAGLRTLVKDGRFIIGWDPAVRGFFWVAGLGGHGVTTSSAVGALAADLLVGEERREAADFSPARFLPQRSQTV